MTDPKFVHLRVHSEYSLVDGIVRIKPLVQRAVDYGMPAIAITDQVNFFGLVKFYKFALSCGIKPVVGADLLIFNENAPACPDRLSLYVQNQAGYLALTELISRAYQQGQHQGVPMLKYNWLECNNQGLIALSGASYGPIGRALLADNVDLANHLTEKAIDSFEGRFYIELQRTGRPTEQRYIEQVIELAQRFDLPVVATNDVRFMDRSDFEAHEARVCINQGRVLDDQRRPKDYSELQYFRDQQEMCELFSDIPEALVNSIEIAKRCNLELQLGENCLPKYPIPDGSTTEEYFIELSKQGLAERLRITPPVGEESVEENAKIYEQRLDRELSVILQMGFPGYFLIVADFIRWAKENAIPVGPGRGSGAGSLVAYALKITDLDPIEFDLLFERFLNPERVSMPDFDVDFCMEGRDRVIDYVAENYGRDRVSQIITYGSMAARAVVRDVGRVLGHPYGFVDQLAKLVPFEIGVTLEKALTDVEELREQYNSNSETRELIDLGLALEGIARNAGKHAGGVVIAPSRLTDFTPLYCEQDGSNLVTQFDKDDVEAVGLVKFDFLGLRTLTIIDWAVQTINQKRQSAGLDLLDIAYIKRDDPAPYALLKSCATTAVFQLESRGMKDLIRRLKPDCFEDIIALVALFRPGPLQSGMVDDYINVKHKVAQAEYAHPLLEPILSPTNGVILYQEQVMEIARVLAGYTLGGADLLRRAMGKKKPEEMAKQRQIFTDGAVKNGVEESVATFIFDLMEKFAGYGFNKSHSAAYALVAYQTAWLKAHYPAAFMAAVLSSDMDNTDKVVVLIEECRSMKLTIYPPDINRSKFRFTVQRDDGIHYGLGAIKGVGEAAIDLIVEERDQHGQFTSLVDFCQRVDLFKVNKRVLEALIKSGAMDVFGRNRATEMKALPTALKIAEQHGKMDLTGQNDLFGLVMDAFELDIDDITDNAADPWSEHQRLTEEKATLGLYLTGHPIDRYEKEIPHLTSGRIGQLFENSDRLINKAGVRIAGLVTELRTRQSKRGKTMAFATLDDRTGRIDIAIFGDVYDRCREYLAQDRVLVATGVLELDDFSGALRLTVEALVSIEEMRETNAESLTIYWRQTEFQSMDRPAAKFVSCLENLIAPFQGGPCPVRIDYNTDRVKTVLQLGDGWKVHPGDELVNRLERQFGKDSFTINYGQD